ncbi:sigma-70 family RNA polymerase sigma factor [Nocardioides sp.]|uniref:sigma-70 family RNA polymerase sigma factor n=1 Tax=Nocardioides sp. TaxID=35761 RepID=UPI002620A38E|nr:sigma-70 family RNA polymerase sigma factor [Nocardioides sp.]
MDRTEGFEHERPRLLGIATRVLGDHAEAEDVVQQAWLRLHRTDAADGAPIESLPAWLTTVTTRLCLDRLRARIPAPIDGVEELHDGTEVAWASDPAGDVALADTVGLALQVVLERLSPRERVAFVLHDSFGVEFPTIATILDTTPAAARKLASRARTKVSAPAHEVAHTTDWEVVDAFMAAAKAGEFERLLSLLAPDATMTADAAAVVVGTPERIEGRREVAEFLNGSAHAALAVFAGDRPGAAWYDRGTARVLFDFTVVDGRVAGIVFRADPDVLADVVRRDGGTRRG